MVSARLKNDLEAWCKSNNPANDAIFEKFIQLAGMIEEMAKRMEEMEKRRK